jgi:CHAT domain-containing protein
VHVIAHAGRRGDDPTLSWLDLAGSRLTAADLARARIESRCVVLSACDAAAPAGDTAAGLISPASSLVGAGARAVIAATEPVGHGDVHALLERLHAGLAAGAPPHRALHDARAANDGNRAAESFVCLIC